MSRVPFALLAVLLSASAGRGDEAVLATGRRVGGTLGLGRDGALRFQPTGGNAPLDLAGVASVRLGGAAAPFRAAPGRLLRLPGGQQLSGIFLGLDGERLALRTAWAERVEVPRGAAHGLTQLPGWHGVFHDELTGKLTGWAVEGDPKTDRGGLTLDRPGQAVAFRPPAGLSAGRVGVNVRPVGSLAGARWLLEARFAHPDGPRTVRVGVGAGVEATGLTGAGRRLELAADWQRLTLAFTAEAVTVTRDDDIVWTSKQGPGELREIRLACLAGGVPRGAVAWSAFCVERAVPEYRRPPGDPNQDELWLAGGDQLFGTVTGADADGIVLRGRFGTRTYAWSQLRGWFPRQQAVRPVATGRGPTVRLWLDGGLRPEPDEVEGTLTALDGRSLTLRHPLLGELRLPRDRVRRVIPLDAAR